MKLLVIVSGDYGELGTAMYFLQGLRSPQVQVLLLPASLAHTMASMPGLDVRTYADLADIRRVIVDTRPDTAILASGYLFPINSGLSLLDSVRMLRTLGRRGVTVLTTDPFFGLLRSRALDFRDVQDPGRDRRSAFAASWRFACRLFLVRHMLRRALHIYPVPIDGLRPERSVRRVSYCNAAAQSAPAIVADRDQRPMWLFVLSKTDLEMQMRVQGDGFVEKIIGRLRDSVALGRDAVLIAPEELVGEVRARLGAELGVKAYSDTSYAGYMQSLMLAEYVFFWNYYSFSVIHRVLADRPVFFFDEGHMVHILPALGREGVRVIYDGWRPPLLPLEKRFDEQELSRRALEVSQQFRRIGDGLRRCLSPEELLRRATRQAQS